MYCGQRKTISKATKKFITKNNNKADVVITMSCQFSYFCQLLLEVQPKITNIAFAICKQADDDCG